MVAGGEVLHRGGSGKIAVLPDLSKAGSGVGELHGGVYDHLVVVEFRRDSGDSEAERALLQLSAVVGDG